MDIAKATGSLWENGPVIPDEAYQNPTTLRPAAIKALGDWMNRCGDVRQRLRAMSNRQAERGDKATDEALKRAMQLLGYAQAQGRYEWIRTHWAIRMPIRNVAELADWCRLQHGCLEAYDQTDRAFVAAIRIGTSVTTAPSRSRGLGDDGTSPFDKDERMRQRTVPCSNDTKVALGNDVFRWASPLFNAATDADLLEATDSIPPFDKTIECWNLFVNGMVRRAYASLRQVAGSVPAPEPTEEVIGLAAARHHLDAVIRWCEAHAGDMPLAPRVPDSQVSLPTPDETGLSDATPQQFKGGTMVFFADRVELCGVVICSGSRSQTKRRILDVLAKKRSDGTFVAYNSQELADQVKAKGGQGTISGAIRDLRDDIAARLSREANIACGRPDLIESGGAGYRFCKRLTVKFDGDPVVAPITDISRERDVRNVRNADVRNVRDEAESPENVAARRAWILERLRAGEQLQAPDVKKQFKRSLKTAERDLQSLRNEGRIEFVGARRTGYYRLVPGTE